MENFIEQCEKLMINFAKEKNMSPQQMLSDFQTALLNIAGWICECHGYPYDKYEAFMREYANQVSESVERRFRKEE